MSVLEKLITVLGAVFVVGCYLLLRRQWDFSDTGVDVIFVIAMLLCVVGLRRWMKLNFDDQGRVRPEAEVGRWLRPKTKK